MGNGDLIGVLAPVSLTGSSQITSSGGGGGANNMYAFQNATGVNTCTATPFKFMLMNDPQTISHLNYVIENVPGSGTDIVIAISQGADIFTSTIGSSTAPGIYQGRLTTNAVTSGDTPVNVSANVTVEGEGGLELNFWCYLTLA